MNKIARNHLDRLQTALLGRHSMGTLSKWVTENTYHSGANYSFVDHEYQEVILNDTSQEVNVRKCSQVGVSECTARMALAMTNVINPLTLIYVLPTAKFATTFMKTRIDPVIQGSSALKENVHRTNDNSEFKQFLESFLYVRGCASNNAPISVPADVIVSDETDFSDQEVLSQYTSRLTHSKWKIVRRLSTPTLPNFGIDKAFQESRRYFNMVKCNHCNHYFVPDYYKDVKVPGFSGNLKEINKQTLTRVKWQEAYVACPKCGCQPSLQIEHREYVCENPDENFIAAGYQVSPFDAPNIISPSYLIRASTMYDRAADFVNFSLGLPFDDKEATLTRDDFTGLFIRGAEADPGAYVMGVDVGNVYHFVIGKVNGWGDILVVHTEQVPMGIAKDRYHELRKQYRVACSTVDSNPHSETVLSLQQTDPNLYAAVYVKSKSMTTHTVHDKEEDKDKGQEFLRQVNINRSRSFDAYMNFVRDGKLAIMDSDQKELIISHHCSMKRVREFDNDSGELVFQWKKTDGMDHYHHAFQYMLVASKIMGVGKPLIIMPTTTLYTFRQKPILTSSN